MAGSVSLLATLALENISKVFLIPTILIVFLTVLVVQFNAKSPSSRHTKVKTKKQDKEWLSKKLSRAIDDCYTIDFGKPALLAAMEHDLDKCRKFRGNIVSQESKSIDYCCKRLNGLEAERDFNFDTSTYLLKESFIAMLGLADESRSCNSCVLENLHTSCGSESDNNVGEKRKLLSGLQSSEKRAVFAAAYEKFLLQCVAPHVASYIEGLDVIYYQSFPCVRVVRPGEFSIGIHCDATYGFSFANINFYVPLTRIYGTNSLALESRPGQEDWHVIDSKYGNVKRFHGSACSHFTFENTTPITRVSLDFRVVPGNLWDPDRNDQYCRTPGYYLSCRRNADGLWDREGADAIPEPDYRMGFPFTKRKL